MYDPYARFETAVLPNGLTLRVLYQPSHPWVATNLVVHSGSSTGSPQDRGVAHFVEHLISDNVQGHRAADIEAFFKKEGGGVNLGCTSFLGTRYKFFLPAEEELVKRAANIFGSAFFNHGLTYEVERERSVILQEFRRNFSFDYEFEWMQQIYSQLRLRFIGGGSFSGLGTLETITSLTHKQLEQFYQQWYTPQNVSLVAVGGLTLKQWEELLLTTALSRVKVGKRCPLPDPVEEISSPPVDRLEFHLGEYSTAPVEFLNIVYGVCLPGRFRSSAVIEIGRRMLASLLFEELREKRGWAYASRADCTDFGSVVELLAAGEKVSLEAVGEIESVIANIFSLMPNEKEMFETNKQSRVKGTLLHDVDDRDICDNAADDLEKYHHIETLSEIAECTGALTIADLEEFCRHCQRDKALMVVKLP